MARTFRLKRNRKSNKKGGRKPGNRSTVLKKKRTKRLRREKMMRGGDEDRPQKILLIIDPQNDFMDIEMTQKKRVPKYTTTAFDQTGESEGLPVPNAKNDMDKLADFLKKNPTFFDEIHVSLDSHTASHIGHRGFWSPDTDIRPLQTFLVNDNDPNYNIYIGDALGKKIEPEKKAKTYNDSLQLWAYHYILLMQRKTGKPPPCLWAKHCIRGGEGWKVYGPLGEVLGSEKYEDKVFYHEKGTNNLVEMYSIFSSEVKYDDVIKAVTSLGTTESNQTLKTALLHHSQINLIPENKELNVVNSVPNTNTDFNQELADRLYGVNKNNNHIYICGEAKSHCVKTSIEDLLKNISEKNIKLVESGEGLQIHAITDMMSGIPGFEGPTEDAFAAMKVEGVQMVVSTENGFIPAPDPIILPAAETSAP